MQRIRKPWGLTNVDLKDSVIDNRQWTFISLDVGNCLSSLDLLHHVYVFHT